MASFITTEKKLKFLKSEEQEKNSITKQKNRNNKIQKENFLYI